MNLVITWKAKETILEMILEQPDHQKALILALPLANLAAVSSSGKGKFFK